MTKKKICICIFSCVFFCVASIFCALFMEEPVLFTKDPSEYNTEKYPVPSTIFPAKIPENAQVITFLHYYYWHEEQDIYLEIKFNTIGEMEQYLDMLKAACLKSLENNYPSLEKDWFIEVQNIYDADFTDLFCTLYQSSQNNKSFTGYTITPGDNTWYLCNFGLISYSYEELTVVHNYVYGSYLKKEDKHIPNYFLRFQVPINKKHERILFLE